MKDAIILLVCQFPAIVCAGGAVVLAYQGKSEWRWLLFVAVLLTVSWKTGGAR